MAHKLSSTVQAENTILSLGQVVTINIISDAPNYFLLHFWNEVPYTRVEQRTYSTESETLPRQRNVTMLSRSFLRCRYAWVALSRSYYYAERTYPKPADSVSAIKEKPSILSHTSSLFRY